MAILTLLNLVLLLSVPAVYVVAVCLLSVWLVFGRSHFAIRTFGYLLGATVLGLPLYLIDRQLVAQIFLGSSATALLLASLRWLDFRMVSLAPGIHREAMERGTGKPLDDWIRELNHKGAQSWTTQKIGTYVRSFGNSEQWTQTIVVAYAKCTGRAVIEQSDIGEPLYAVPLRNRGISPIVATLHQQRWSIKQLLYAFIFVALLFSILRLAPLGGLKDPKLASLTLILSIVCGSISIFAIISCLSLTGPTARSWLVLYALFGGLFFLCKYVGINAYVQSGIGVPFVCEWIAILAVPVSLELMFALMFIRQYGYRFVLVQRAPQHQENLA
jgi:hypothetical protein